MVGQVRYGFVVHPLNRSHLRLMRLWTGLRRTDVILDYPPLHTTDGLTLEGRVVGVPFDPAAMLDDQEAAVQAIARAAVALKAWGASCVGLGALAAVVGGRGREVARLAGFPVSTGYSLTTFAALQTLRLAWERQGLPASEPVAVLGAPGPVALGLAGCLALGGTRVLLALDPVPPPVGRFIARYPGITPTTRAEALAGSRLVAAASSTGASLDEEEPRPGSVVIDVAEPRDLPKRPTRKDLVVIDGELMRLPRGTPLTGLAKIYNRVVGQGLEHVFACFVEPMVMASLPPKEADDLCAYRRHPDPERILRLGERALAMGFEVDDLFYRARRVRGHHGAGG